MAEQKHIGITGGAGLSSASTHTPVSIEGLAAARAAVAPAIRVEEIRVKVVMEADGAVAAQLVGIARYGERTASVSIPVAAPPSLTRALLELLAAGQDELLQTAMVGAADGVLAAVRLGEQPFAPQAEQPNIVVPNEHSDPIE